MNQEMATINHPQEQVLEEEELLLLQETAATNASSSFFNDPAAATECFTHLHLNNRHQPPCTSCGSHKRPSSANPISHLQPNPKKPNTTITATHSLFGFSKIPLSPPPFLRRCSSDPYIPPLPPVVEEPPVLPRPNAEPECPGTRLSNVIASNKLPPRSPTLRRSVSELLPSPEKTVSGSSSDSPHAEWVRKMRDCMRDMSRKWGELLGDEKDTSNEEINNDNSSRGVNNGSNNDAKLENYEGGHVEVLSVEKKGDALILHFKCPCMWQWISDSSVRRELLLQAHVNLAYNFALISRYPLLMELLITCWVWVLSVQISSWLFLYIAILSLSDSCFYFTMR